MKNPTVILFVSAFIIIILHQKAPEELRYPVTPRVQYRIHILIQPFLILIVGSKMIIPKKQRPGLLNKMHLLTPTCVEYPSVIKSKKD